MSVPVGAVPTAVARLAPTAVARLVAAGRAGRGFLRAMMREDAYEKYRAHVLASGESGTHSAASSGSSCAPRLMTEREFWRDQTDRQEHNPQGRCC